MHKNKQVVLLISIYLVLCLLPLASGLSYQEGIHLLRPESQYITNTFTVPEYLTVEDVTFVSCLETENVLRNSLLCLDDNSFEDLETVPWSKADNCYVSSYNLEDFQCEQLLLQAEYTEDGENHKLTKTIRVNKLSTVMDKLLETQYSDGGWKDPLSTAYGIWALSHFKDIYDYELDMAMTWLKKNRNEEEKCWPKSPCNVELSSNVLSLLILSNYTGELLDDDDARRVVNDARNLFEELQNDYEQGDEWRIDVLPMNNYTTLALAAYEQEVFDENFTLPDEKKTYPFKAETGKEVIIIADDNVYVNVTNQDDETLVMYQGDNLSYTIPGPCWSLNKKGEPCDKTTTVFALTADIDEDQKELAKDWLRDQLSLGSVLGYYYGDEEYVSVYDEDDRFLYNKKNAAIIDTSLYLYNLYKDDKDEDYFFEVVDWLLYSQNNEGSWGANETTNKSIPTAYAALALSSIGFNRTTEPILDAEQWASDNEDDLLMNDTKALASLFYVLQNHARPVLVTSPKVIIVDKPELTIDLFNPTMFDLKDLTYEFSEELDDDLSVQTKEEIDAYSYRRLKITRTASTKKDAYGFLTVKNLDDPVAVIPVILADTPTLNITVPETATVFGRSGELRVSATKSDHNFVCQMRWNGNDISTPGSVRITNNGFVIPVEFSQALTKDDAYAGTLSCNAVGKTLELPVSVYINRFAAVPLTIKPSDVIVNYTDKNVDFTLINNLDTDLTVQVSLDRYGSYFSFPTSVTLNPNEQYNFTLKNNLPSDLNLTSSVLVNFKVFDRTTSASMLIDVVETTPEVKSPFLVLLPLIFVIIVLGVAAYFAWKFRDIIIAELNKLNIVKVKEEKKKESKRIKTLKSTEQKQAITNMFNIMKFQNKDEKEIAQRLKASFPVDTIKEALDDAGLSLPVLDEEEPEKA